MNSFRGVFLVGFLACLSMLLIAGYFQFIEHLEPCPLCILQRVMVFVAGVFFLIGAIHNPVTTGRRVYGFLVLLAAGIGAAISARHVWIQNLPEDQVPSCGPGLNFILENFPLSQAVDMVLKGSGECADVLWTFLNLSIPAWTFIAFIVMCLVGLKQLFGHHKHPDFI
ncbi:MAG: disulfide bond formation protein B [Pseudomonadota bacterium]|uniref:Disulfide bond formation protein B n=1 Tax=Methylophaga aminisulfidivorans MP TaxID=1026882 RepID=F5SVM1_9GAMM|nr:disulfide bond formation protein B [Methylophaga aminisulfidivorans]EGL55931.1 disulfide bond formation protein DsbB [Methylophaga aminisulfidivorans MP]MEC9412034.1 disulfide bond formation protein B [Pseudomonadota bacterium]